jgi:hypothetical protein
VRPTTITRRSSAVASQSYTAEAKVRCMPSHELTVTSSLVIVCRAACFSVVQPSTESTFRVQGDKESMEWRMFFSEKGSPISPWHDIPLTAGSSTYNFVCEIPKETAAKMECCLVRPKPLSAFVRT